MPLDVLGRTRVTMARTESASKRRSRGRKVLVTLNPCLDWDRSLQLLVSNEEFLVIVGH
jgi:hypothetical protein